jgi:gp16 family phage-associated protein
MHVKPGTSLFNSVRAGFTAKGSSLNKWCVEQGFTPSWVYQAIKGKRRGPAAQRVADQAAQAAGVVFAHDHD